MRGRGVQEEFIMKYEEIVKKVKTAYAKADASKVEGHVAIQVDVTGEGEGAFYIEIADGKVAVEPYEYKDKDAKIIANAEDILAVVAGKKGADTLYVEGNTEKALVLNTLVAKKAPAKKAPAKKAVAAKKTEEKAPAKKPAAKKPATVKAVAAKPVAEKKVEAKTATAKKPVAKKATAKKTATK